MKKTALLFLLLCTLLNSRAQLRVAIAGGGHLASVLETNSIPGWDTATGDYYSGRVGFHGGFLADLPFKTGSKVSFQPGVIFHMKGRKYSKSFNPPAGTVTNQKSTQYVNYVDVPLNLVLKLGKKTKFILGGGPYVSLFFNGSETAQTTTTTGVSSSSESDDLPVGKKEGQYEVLNYGVNGLLGIESGRVFITANYSRGMNDFYHAIGYSGSFKHQVIGGTLGIFLGKPVKVVKVPKDKDKDGIPDEKDECPDQAGTALTRGCPDQDGDGIADKEDECPAQPGVQQYKGCPATDQDKDGVNDKEDKCPDLAGVPRYAGCPVPDTDKDGVNDEEDQCPNQAGSPKYKGCPVPDTDGDGINDEADKCPAVKGTREYEGCPPPEIRKEVIEKVNYAAKRIQFQSSKAVLQPASLKVLDEVAVILKENPGLLLTIEGHTSADGSLAFNMKLSEDRAEAVKKYLLTKGVDASRLKAEGFGPERPLVPGNSAAARNQNRRVELKLSN